MSVASNGEMCGFMQSEL